MQATQSAIRADPEVAVMVFAEGANNIVDQSLLHRVPDDPARVNSSDPLPVRPDPQRPGAVAEDIARRHPAERSREPDGLDRLSRDAKQFAVQGRHEEVPA